MYALEQLRILFTSDPSFFRQLAFNAIDISSRNKSRKIIADSQGMLYLGEKDSQSMPMHALNWWAIWIFFQSADSWLSDAICTSSRNNSHEIFDDFQKMLYLDGKTSTENTNVRIELVGDSNLFSVSRFVVQMQFVLSNKNHDFIVGSQQSSKIKSRGFKRNSHVLSKQKSRLHCQFSAILKDKVPWLQMQLVRPFKTKTMTSLSIVSNFQKSNPVALNATRTFSQNKHHDFIVNSQQFPKLFSIGSISYYCEEYRYYDPAEEFQLWIFQLS